MSIIQSRSKLAFSAFIVLMMIIFLAAYLNRASLGERLEHWVGQAPTAPPASLHHQPDGLPSLSLANLPASGPPSSSPADSAANIFKQAPARYRRGPRPPPISSAKAPPRWPTPEVWPNTAPPRYTKALPHRLPAQKPLLALVRWRKKSAPASPYWSGAGNWAGNRNHCASYHGKRCWSSG